MLLIGLAVQRSLAGDGDVLALEGVDERRVVHQLHAFEARENEWIAGGILRKAQRRAFLQVELDAAAKSERVGRMIAGRNHHPPAARPCARLDGLLDGRIGGGDELALGEAGRDDAGQDVGKARPRIAASP